MTSGAPVLFSAEEASPIVHKSANWLKVHARTGAIPSTKLGRTTLFTPQQLAEIARAGARAPAPGASLPSRAPQRRQADDPGDGTLQARTPRRKLTKGSA